MTVTNRHYLMVSVMQPNVIIIFTWNEESKAPWLPDIISANDLNETEMGPKTQKT